MSLYGGIDLHANNSVVVLLNDQDQVIYQKRLPNHLPAILEPFHLYRGEIAGVVVESTYNWYWLVDGLMEAGYHVHLANPAAIEQYSGLEVPHFLWGAAMKHLRHQVIVVGRLVARMGALKRLPVLGEDLLKDVPVS